jgi:hypothetical protein
MNFVIPKIGPAALSHSSSEPGERVRDLGRWVVDLYRVLRNARITHMGEAKRKKRLSARILQEHPFCCYCGGGVAATTIDHVPAKILFPYKRRPRGLEVPACTACNKANSKFDQMAGVFSRVSKQDPVVTDRDEFKKLVANVHKDFPGWASELSGDASEWEVSLKAVFGKDRDKVASVTVGPITKLWPQSLVLPFTSIKQM